MYLTLEANEYEEDLITRRGRSDKIRLWEKEQGTNNLKGRRILFRTYKVEKNPRRESYQLVWYVDGFKETLELPAQLYVEGLRRSNKSRDTEIKVIFTIGGPQSAKVYRFEDKVRLTIVGVEIEKVIGLRVNEVGNYGQQRNPREGGRLFIDTIDTGGILENPDHQRVRFLVVVYPNDLPGEELRIRWEARDPDDPATHYEIDPNDGGTPAVPLGTTPIGGDNFDLRPENAPHWFMPTQEHPMSDQEDPIVLDEYDVMGRGITEVSFENGRIISSAYFHYSDEGGDNYKVRAVLIFNGRDFVSDETGIMTVWRKRFVRVDAMERVSDDVQAVPLNEATPIAETPVVTAGADGVLDTIPGGDDEIDLTANVIIAGANLRCDTDARRPNWYPGENLAAIQQSLRESFANADANRNCYIDIEVSEGNIATTSVATLTYTFLTLSTYVANDTGYPNEHPRNTYHLIGIREFSSLSYGNSDIDPHSFVAVRRVYYRPSIFDGFHNIYYINAHELGHSIFQNNQNIHEDHSYAPFGSCVGAVRAPAMMVLYWCPRHVRIVRDNVTRGWPTHIVGAINPSENDLDSDP